MPFWGCCGVILVCSEWGRGLLWVGVASNGQRDRLHDCKEWHLRVKEIISYRV